MLATLAAGALTLSACHSNQTPVEDEGPTPSRDVAENYQLKDSPRRFHIGVPKDAQVRTHSQRPRTIAEATGDPQLDAELQRISDRESDASAQARFDAAVLLYRVGRTTEAQALFAESMALRVSWMPALTRIDRDPRLPAQQPPGSSVYAQFWDLGKELNLSNVVDAWETQGEAEGVKYSLGAHPVATRDLLAAAIEGQGSQIPNPQLIAANSNVLVIGNEMQLDSFTSIMENLVSANEKELGNAFTITTKLYGLDFLPKKSDPDTAARDLDFDGQWDIGVLHRGIKADEFSTALRLNGEHDPELLSAPRVTAYGWQPAVLEISNQVTFVRGVDIVPSKGKDYVGDPQLDVVRDGMSLSLRAAPVAGGRIALAFRLESARLTRPIREEQVRVGDSTFQFQVPELLRWEMASGGVVNENESAIVLVPVDPSSGAKGYVAVELTVQRVKLNDATPDGDLPESGEQEY